MIYLTGACCHWHCYEKLRKCWHFFTVESHVVKLSAQTSDIRFRRLTIYCFELLFPRGKWFLLELLEQNLKHFPLQNGRHVYIAVFWSHKTVFSLTQTQICPSEEISTVWWSAGDTHSPEWLQLNIKCIVQV